MAWLARVPERVRDHRARRAALALEQGVQAIEWQRRVADAEHDFHAELATNARNAFGRLVTVRCARAQFDAVRQALVENRDEGTPVKGIQPFLRGAQSWFTDSWESARALQLTGHLSTKRLRQYSLAYTLAGTFRERQRQEQDLKPPVDTLSDNGGRLTPQERDRLFLALHELEQHSNLLDNLAFRYLESLRPLGVTINAQDRGRVIAERRAHEAVFGGDCVQDPSPWLNDGDKAGAWLLFRKGEP